MEKTGFEEFCVLTIDAYIDELREIDKEYGALTVRESRKKYVYLFYEIARMNIRKYFMQLESKPMDRHKIGSVMAYAILRSKIIKVNRLIPDLPEKILMANEYLAFTVAMNIVEIYKREMEDYRFHEGYTLFMPRTYHENEKSTESVYLSNVCKALYYIPSMRRFDIFAYANILFLLEKYTDLSKEYDEQNQKK